MQRSPVGISAENITGTPDTFSLDRDERQIRFFLRGRIGNGMGTGPLPVVIRFDQLCNDFSANRFCRTCRSVEREEHIVQTFRKIVLHPEVNRIQPAFSLIFNAQFSAELFCGFRTAGKKRAAAGNVFPDPCGKFIGNFQSFRQDQEFVLFPGLDAVRDHHIKLHLEFLQHPDGTAERFRVTERKFIPGGNDRSIRQLHGIFQPRVVLLKFRIDIMDPVKDRLIFVAPGVKMPADIRSHAVRHTVNQVIHQAVFCTQSAEIAPVVKSAGHVQHLHAGFDVADEVRHGRQTFIAPDRGGQTFKVKERFQIPHIPEKRSVEKQHGIRDDLFDRCGYIPAHTHDGFVREGGDGTLIRIVDISLLHHFDAGRADTGKVAQAVDKKSLHRIFLRHFPDHGKQMIPERRIETCRDGERIDLPVEIVTVIKTVGSPFPVFDQFHGADSAVQVCDQSDIFLPAALGKFSEQVVIQSGVAGTDLRVVICHSHITAGMERNIIHIASFGFIGKMFRVEISADIRIFHLRVVVIEQGISDFVHFPAFFFYGVLSGSRKTPDCNAAGPLLQGMSLR